MMLPFLSVVKVVVVAPSVSGDTNLTPEISNAYGVTGAETVPPPEPEPPPHAANAKTDVSSVIFFIPFPFVWINKKPPWEYTAVGVLVNHNFNDSVAFGMFPVV